MSQVMPKFKAQIKGQQEGEVGDEFHLLLELSADSTTPIQAPIQKYVTTLALLVEGPENLTLVPSDNYNGTYSLSMRLTLCGLYDVGVSLFLLLRDNNTSGFDKWQEGTL